MRFDYVLYAVAIILFIVTLAVAVYAAEQQLWIVTTAVVAFAFIGLGYTQRPKTTALMNVQPAPPTPPSPAPQPIVTEAVKLEEVKPVVQEAVEPIVQPQPAAAALMKVRGIGEKRATQLRALGISSIEDLANASANDLGAKLNISPKITKKWIENAKELTHRT